MQITAENVLAMLAITELHLRLRKNLHINGKSFAEMTNAELRDFAKENIYSELIGTSEAFALQDDLTAGKILNRMVKH